MRDFHVFVRTLNGQTITLLDLKATNTVEELKQKVGQLQAGVHY